MKMEQALVVLDKQGTLHVFTKPRVFFFFFLFRPMLGIALNEADREHVQNTYVEI